MAQINYEIKELQNGKNYETNLYQKGNFGKNILEKK